MTEHFLIYVRMCVSVCVYIRMTTLIRLPLLSLSFPLLSNFHDLSFNVFPLFSSILKDLQLPGQKVTFITEITKRKKSPYFLHRLFHFTFGKLLLHSECIRNTRAGVEDMIIAWLMKKIRHFLSLHAIPNLHGKLTGMVCQISSLQKPQAFP